MQKIYKVFLSLIIFSLVSLLIPFNVSADSATYKLYESSEGCVEFGISGSRYYVFNADGDLRFIKDAYGYIYLVTINSSTKFMFTNNSNNYPSACAAMTTPVSYQGSYNGQSYYGTKLNSIYNDGWQADVPQNSNVFNWQLAYRYTFGDLSVDPVPQMNYGELIVGFHTNFSASGTTNNYTITSNTNLDTIEWQNIDSNGNDLQNKGINVEIRAVPILYSANSKSALDLLGFQDAVVDSNNGLILWQGNFNDNHKSFIWNDVINQLQTSNPAFTITSLLTGSVWTRYGWIYQIRYNDVLNSYSSEWQTIYNSTSIKVSDSEKIVNQYYYHYPSGVGSDDQDIFHDINTVNNTTNNWYVNDVPVDPGASWLDALIQAIAEILGKILDFFSSIFDGLVDLILGLFGDINPADSFFNWFSNLFNGIGEIDLTLPQFNIPSIDLSSFNRLVQETLNIFSFNNFGFVIFIPLLLLIIKAVF